jgi:hypothetical protein
MHSPIKEPTGAKLNRFVLTHLLKTVLIAFFIFVFLPWGGHGYFTSLSQISVDIGFEAAGPRLFLQGTQFGPDAVLTYGPLEFLAFNPPGYPPSGLLIPYYVFRILLAAVVPLLLMRFVEEKSAAAKIVAFIAVLALGYFWFIGFDQAFWLTPAIAVALSQLSQKQAPRSDPLVWLAVALIAVLALVKFSFLIIGAWALFIVALHDVVVRRRIPLLSLAFVLFVGLEWYLIGQQPENLALWISRSMEVSSGYGDAMPKGWLAPYDLSQITLFYAAIALPPIWIFAEAVRHRTRSLSLFITALFVLGVEYVGLRYAFGGNMLLQVLFINFILLFGLSWQAEHRDQMILRRIGLALSALCCLGIILIDQALLPSAWAARSWLFANTNSLLGSVFYHTPMFDPPGTVERGINALSRLPATMSGTTDIYPWKTSIILANSKLEYRPRPVYISLVAYTARLATINRDFLRSKHAPENILFEITPAEERIDDKYPATSDSLSWPEILARYQPASSRRDLAILHRRTNPAQPAINPIESIIGRLGQPVGPTTPLDSSAHSLLWATIDVQPSIFGRILKLIYKSPPIDLILTTTDGVEHRHQIVAELGRAGFLLSPYINDTREFLALVASTAQNDWSSPAGQVVKSLTVSPRIGPKWFYQNDYKITLSSLTFSGGIPDGDDQQEMATIIGLRNIMREPENCLFAPSLISSADGSGYSIFAHAPCVIPVSIPEGSRGVTFGFGLRDTAFTNADGKSRGALFQIFARPVGDTDKLKRKLIWSALLDPTSVKADRGLHTLTLPLEDLVLPGATPNSAAELVFATAPKPGTDPTYDHTYWSDIKFSP